MKYILLTLAAAMLLTVAVPTQSSITPRATVRELGAGNCSGVVLRPGIILTAWHCVDQPSLVTRPGGATPEVLGKGDERLDYALLRFPVADAPCPCAELGASEGQVDESVVIVGYPYGLRTQVLTFGTSQGVADHSEMPYGRRLITTALVGGGNSGGGVFALRPGGFELIGLLVESKGHLSFAVPLADLRPFLAKFDEKLSEKQP